MDGGVLLSGGFHNQEASMRRLFAAVFATAFVFTLSACNSCGCNQPNSCNTCNQPNSCNTCNQPNSCNTCNQPNKCNLPSIIEATQPRRSALTSFARVT